MYIGTEKPNLKFHLKIFICYEDIKDFVVLEFLKVHVYSLLYLGPFCMVHSLEPKDFRLLR